MGDLLLFVNLICFVVTIMIIWFKSGAFVEYCKLLKLKTLLLGYDKDPNNLTYPQYLYVKSRTLFKCPICKFLISLITCPLCISVWLCIVVACLYGTILLMPVFYISVLAIYFSIERLIE